MMLLLILLGVYASHLVMWKVLLMVLLWLCVGGVLLFRRDIAVKSALDSAWPRRSNHVLPLPLMHMIHHVVIVSAAVEIEQSASWGAGQGVPTVVELRDRFAEVGWLRSVGTWNLHLRPQFLIAGITSQPLRHRQRGRGA